MNPLTLNQIFLFLAGGLLSVIFPVIIKYSRDKLSEKARIDEVQKFYLQHKIPGIENAKEYIKNNNRNAPPLSNVILENLLLPVVIMSLTQTLFAPRDWSLLVLGFFIAVFLVYELLLINLSKHTFLKYFYCIVTWALFSVYLIANVSNCFSSVVTNFVNNLIK